MNSGVAHYTGHRCRGPNDKRWQSVCPAGILETVDKVIRDNNLGLLLGSLAAGGDILFAERALVSGCAVQLYFPSELDSFVQKSVMPGGRSWVRRFERVLSSAEQVAFVAGDEGDVYAEVTRLALGDAVSISDRTSTDKIQLSLWDGVPNLQTEGTAGDILQAKRLGFETIVVNRLCTGGRQYG